MSSDTEEVSSPEIHFEPIVQLPAIEVKSMEEEEEELFKMRAKLFRYDSAVEPPEWKERGTGDLKMLRKRGQVVVRILMRRDKTLKICANHYIQPEMALKPHSGSDRAFVWSTPADFADEESKPEMLAIRFANIDNAEKFRAKFEEIQNELKSSRIKGDGDDKHPVGNELPAATTNGEAASEDSPDKAAESKPAQEAEEVAEKLGALSVDDQKPSKESEEKTDATSD